MLAQETAKLFAREGAVFVLVARDRQKLDAAAKELAAQGAGRVEVMVMDVKDTAAYASLLKQALSQLGGVDVALLAHGSSQDQIACERDPAVLADEIQVNFTSTAMLLMRLADIFEQQRYGVIAVITSVSGDRGRRCQYVYGACKGGLTIFLQGLRQRLFPAHVAVVTVKAGLARTPLTARVSEGRMRWLSVGPDVVARGIYRAIKARKDEVYVPWFWGCLMVGVRAIPQALFKRMSF